MRVLVVSLLSCLVVCVVGCDSVKRGRPAGGASDGATVSETSRDDGGHGAEAREYFKRGIDLYNRDEDEKAVEAFKEAIRLEPDYAEAHFRLGLAFAALGQKEDAAEAYKKAVEAYRKIVRLNPKDAEAQFNMGQAQSRLGQYEEAVKAYRQAVRIQPDQSDMHYELGDALSKLAQYREAVRAFERVLELEPENYRASDALEEAREGAKRRDTIVKRQEEALKRQMAKAGASPSPSASPPPKSP